MAKPVIVLLFEIKIETFWRSDVREGYYPNFNFKFIFQKKRL